MISHKIYEDAEKKALSRIKRQRDASELQSVEKDSSLREVFDLELFKFKDDDAAGYDFTLRQAEEIAFEMFSEVIISLLKEYDIPAKQIKVDRRQAMRMKTLIFLTERDETLHLFRALGTPELPGSEINSMVVATGAKRMRQTLLTYDYAYRTMFNHNHDENDPSRGTGRYSIHDFFKDYFDEEEYNAFKRFEADFTKSVRDYLGFKVTRTLTTNTLYSFKRRVAFMLKEGKEYDEDVLNRIETKQLSLIKDSFLQEGHYKAMLAKGVKYDFLDYDINFAQSFVTAEWLFDNMQEAGSIDYTSVAMGYFKSIEQLMFAVVLLHEGGGRELKKNKAYNQYEKITSDNIKADALDTTLGSLVGFFRYFHNRDLFRDLIEDDTKDIILDYFSGVKELRNGYFHKENLNEWDVVISARKMAYTIAMFILGAYNYSSEDKKALNIPDVVKGNDFTDLCEYMTYNSDQLFYFSMNGEDLVPGFSVSDEELTFNEYGDPKFSGVYLRPLGGIGSEKVVVPIQQRSILSPGETKKYTEETLPVKIYTGEMKPCSEGMEFSGALDLIYDNGKYYLPELKDKPRY